MAGTVPGPVSPQPLTAARLLPCPPLPFPVQPRQSRCEAIGRPALPDPGTGQRATLRSVAPANAQLVGASRTRKMNGTLPPPLFLLPAPSSASPSQALVEGNYLGRPVRIYDATHRP